MAQERKGRVASGEGEEKEVSDIEDEDEEEKTDLSNEKEAGPQQ